MAAEDYEAGNAKQNADTGAVAVRTVFPDMPAFADRQWAVMTVDNGGHYCTYDAVADWPDMVPAESDPAPDPEELQE